MPLLALDPHADDVLGTHPVPLAPREIWLAWQANRTLSPLAERVLELIREVRS